MKILKLNMPVMKNIIIFVVFISLCLCSNKISYATSPSDEEIMQQMYEDLTSWANDCASSGYDVIKYDYDNNGNAETAYAVKMPKTYRNYHTNIKYENGNYYYEVIDDGVVIREIPFEVKVPIADSVNGFNGSLNASNYRNYLDATQGSGLLEISDEGNFIGEAVENIQGDVDLIKLVTLPDGNIRQMAFVIELPNGQTIITQVDEFEIREGYNLADSITNFFTGIWDRVKNAVADFIGYILFHIADGVHNLINSLFGADGELTVYKIIFGKIDKLSIDFWNAGSSDSNTENEETENPTGIVDNAPIHTLKRVVNYWYGFLRGLVISIYITILLYIGVRILLSSTGKGAQKYKDMLTSWLIGIIIIAFFPYIMRYIVIINNSLVTMVGSDAASQEDEDVMHEIRLRAEEENNLALVVVYIILLVQLIILLGIYYKRAFMVAFLITIFPVVAGLYIWEKTNRGSAKAIRTWVNEFMVIVFLQAIHAVVYAVLIDGAYRAFCTNDNWFIFIICVMFLFEAEKIVRAIFGMNSSAKAIGDLATTGAAVLATATAAKSILKGNGRQKSRDEEDLSRVDREVEEANKTTAVNQALSQRYNNPTPISTSSGVGNKVEIQTDPMQSLAAAQAVIAQEGLKARTQKGIVSRALNATTSGLAKATGITLGVTSGLATGDLKQGFANAMIANEVAGGIAKGFNGITGWATGTFGGKVMKKKIGTKQMDDKLRNVGFDLNGKFDENDAISNSKAELIKEALAAQLDATRRAGKEAGELAFVDTIDKGRKKYKL